MIHQYKMFGQNIVLDVYSGSVHIVSDVTYDIISKTNQLSLECPTDIKNELLSKYNEEDIDDSYTEILNLHFKEQLFTDDFYADIANKWNKTSVIKALCLHIAHDCNLRCAYCFADTGSFSGKRGLMSAEVGKKAIDFVIANSGNRKNIEIDYFGGEPLVNFGVVKEITEYAKQQQKIYNKNFRFTITTNGVLLNDEINAYINENMSNVVLSLDGTKETNDAMRYRIDGSGSYDDILPKYKKLVKERNGENYYIRGTFTAKNLDFAKDVLHFVEQGFLQTSIEPVVVPDTVDFALKKEHLDKIYAEYEKLALEYVRLRKEGKPFNFFHFMIDLNQGPCVVKRLAGCGAGTEYLAITPEGDIYPCHQFVGNEDFKMGNIMNNSFDDDKKQVFEKSNVYTKDDCKNCFAKFYCSGGCCANAYNFNGDINKPYSLACDMEKKRVECAIAIKALLATED